MPSHFLYQPIEAPSHAHHQLALARQQQLTKPAGSLGRLESLAVELAAHQHRENPKLDSCHITIFAADHGIAQHSVSAFPQAVTQEMIRNFARGGAAINVLARENNASLDIVNLGTIEAMEQLPGVSQLQIAAGTADFSQGQAMSQDQCQQAFQAGYAAVDSHQRGQLFIAGEMGIGNTSSAAALAAAILGRQCDALIGAGTGIAAEQKLQKQALIETALQRCSLLGELSPEQWLQQLGGLEIAAMCASFIGAAQRGVSILLDGYICCAAALVACKINPGLQPWLIASHRSQEPGHQLILDELQLQPILDLQLRLGEGSGAALCINILKQACSLHNSMATFAEAGVSQ